MNKDFSNIKFSITIIPLQLVLQSINRLNAIHNEQ